MTPFEHCDAIDRRLLNDWQRGFPLVREPYAALAQALGIEPGLVLQRLARLQGAGAFSRIGGTWGAGAGGASTLAAYAVPPSRLEAVAAQVSALPGVNHNYQREHRVNLWFVATAPSQAALDALLAVLDARTGLRALRLPMLQPYRIDLGFDLRQTLAGEARAAHACVAPVAEADRALAAWLEAGVPLLDRPWDRAADALGRPWTAVLQTLQTWLDGGTLRRLGVVVRHHEVGFVHNAMTVFDVPDPAVDAAGQRLARQRSVTLAYRRRRDEGWPYNLYAMVHGRSRDEVRQALHAAAHGAGLGAVPHEVLFSCRRFKQQGGRYFAAVSHAA